MDVALSLILGCFVGSLVGSIVGAVVTYLASSVLIRPALAEAQDRAMCAYLEHENAKLRSELSHALHEQARQSSQDPSEEKVVRSKRRDRISVRQGSLNSTLRPTEPFTERQTTLSPPDRSSNLMFDVFICYRIGCMETTAERLSLALIENDPLWKLTMFWDKRILIPEATFRDWISHSGCIVILMSNKVVESIQSLGPGKTDPLLIEYELAVDRMLDSSPGSTPAILIPVFVGEYDSSGKFSEFTGKDPSSYPAHSSLSCPSRTIRDTLTHILRMEAINMDPNNITPAAQAIASRLYQAFPSKFAGVPLSPTLVTSPLSTASSPAPPASHVVSSVPLLSLASSSSGYAWTPAPSESDLFPEGTVPPRFVRGLQGEGPDVPRERWNMTLKWRSEQAVDGILDEPQLHYETIKKHYFHFFHKRAKDGRFVYYEAPGLSDFAGLRQRGVTTDMCARHFIFLSEVSYRVLSPEQDATSIVIIDAANTNVADVAGEKLELFQAVSKISQSYYVERCGTIFVVNTGFWFRMIWNIVSPFVHKNTRAKMKICGTKNYQQELCDMIGAENVPVQYGGTDPTPLGQSPEELLILQHVRHVIDSSPPPSASASASHTTPQHSFIPSTPTNLSSPAPLPSPANKSI